MKRRPLLLAAVILAAGMGVAPWLWPWRPFVCLAAIVGGLGLLSWYWWRRELSLPLVALTLLLSGALLVGPPLPPGIAGRVTAVRGWLDGEMQVRPDRSYQGSRISAWRLGNGPWCPPGRPIRMWVSNTPAEAGYGRWFEARGRFVLAGTAGVDGYFFPKTICLLPRRSGNPLRRGALALRERMDRSYQRFLSRDEHTLLAGLVFGDLPRLSAEALSWFRDAGALHLLSVSGLHVGFVVVLMLGLASLFGWRGWRAWALTIPVVIGYVCLCGPRPPVLRATVMTLAVGAGMVWRRKVDSGNILGLAALVVLVCQPWALRTVSFQLTFAACAGLVFFYPRWAAWCPPRLAFIGKPFLISLAASLAVLPIQVVAFGRVSSIGPLANLVLVPLAGLAVQVGLLAGLIGSVVIWLVGPVLTGVGIILDLLLVSAKACAHIPGAAFNLAVWPWPVVLGYYVLLVGASHSLERSLLSGRPRVAVGPVVLGLAAALTAVVWWQVLAIPTGLSVTFLDVGQGDCIFIRTPGGQTVLVDGGEDEAGGRVLSYLRRQGVNRLNLVILTHPHSDHVGGLTAVAEEFAIGRVLDPGWPHTSETYRRFLLKLRERGIPWQRARRGLAFNLGSGIKGVVLYPYPETPEPADWNDGSLAIGLRFGQQVLLLPGDLGEEGEEALLASGADLRATVLKVAHHGSATSTGPAWLDAVRPRVAVISVGRGNPFHHPSPETLARLSAAGIKVYRTDQRGTIRYWTDGKKYRIECGRSQGSG